MNAELLPIILGMGFPVGRANLIHAFVGGSALHGIKLEGHDDLDLYGIFIEKPEAVLGLERFEHFVTSTAEDSRRNTEKDVDITCYSLRKWAGLAVKGNPTVVQFLFTPAGIGDVFWSSVLSERQSFLGRSHYHQYAGYADAQLRRMTGQRGRGKHGQRPELQEKNGYNTKAAMHALRLLHEGIELMREGWITLPCPLNEKGPLLEVRTGVWSEERVIQEASRLFAELKEAAAQSKLPEEPDRAAVSRLVTKTYLQFWVEAQPIDLK